MIARGARKFVFLGRTGDDRPKAKELTDILRLCGAHVTVVRGDVSNETDVQLAMEACTATGSVIGGIIQAAMVVTEDLFQRMSNESWHKCVRPKWAGTWNLHHQLEGRDDGLDFFLIASSMTGAVGVATESNYCAANAFQDAFAEWRRTQGKPAVSVGLGMISEVGYLHENPRIEALLLRRGLHPLNEDDFLQMIDIAISGTGENDGVRDSFMVSYILTGMETLGVSKLLDRGFEVTHTVMDDQRSSILAATLDPPENSSVGSGRGSDDSASTFFSAPWLAAVSNVATRAHLAETNASSLQEAILEVISKRFSNLLLMPVEQLDGQKSFGDYGVDSMIASEFRTWFWKTFKVDVPFLDLLSYQQNLVSVAALIETKLLTSDQFNP